VRQEFYRAYLGMSGRGLVILSIGKGYRLPGQSLYPNLWTALYLDGPAIVETYYAAWSPGSVLTISGSGWAPVDSADFKSVGRHPAVSTVGSTPMRSRQANFGSFRGYVRGT
jgi:hypothetical protein